MQFTKQEEEKLWVSIQILEQKKEKLYTELGKQILEDQQFQNISTVKEIYRAKDILNEMIHLIQNILKERPEYENCSKCGNPVRKNAAFCDQCGSCLEPDEEKMTDMDMFKMPDNILLQMDDIIDEKITCHNCGKKLKPGALFCKECGSKISN